MTRDFRFMPQLLRKRRLLTLLLGLGCATSAVALQAPERTADGQPAIFGYSPVSYFTVGRAERGSPEFSVRHEGRTYFLTSVRQQVLFRAAPDRYLPRYAEFCPYSLALGRTLPIDPTNFRIVGGQLLLFHRTGESDGLERWQESRMSEEELLERADRRFRLLEF